MKIAGLQTDTIEKTRNVVKQDKFDKAAWRGVRTSASKLDELCSEGEKQFSPFTDLMQDSFSSLYKYNPELEVSGKVAPSHKLNHELIEKAMGTDAWKKLRASTRMDETLSAVGAMAMGKQFQTVLAEELKKEAEVANSLLKSEQQMQLLQEKAQHYSDLATEAKAYGNLEKAEQFQKKSRTVKRKASEFEGRMQQWASELQKDLNSKKAQAALEAAAAATVKEAHKQASEAQSVLETWGNDAGSMQQMPLEARLELAGQMVNNQKLKRIADMIGKFSRVLAAAERNKVRSESGEIYDLCPGNDLARVVPSEIAMLANPDTKLLFYRRYSEGSLTQYAMRASADAGQGPMIVLIDSSGSMSGARDEWAKAIGISLLHFAQRKNRCFAGIVFSSSEAQLQEFFFNPGEKDLEKTVQFATSFIGGGTNFEPPLKRAATIISENVKFKNADVVLVSDGICQINPDFKDAFVATKLQYDFQIHTILIQTLQENYVKEFSDSVHHVKDLDGSGVLQIMEAVV